MGYLTFAAIERLTVFKLGVFDVRCPQCGPNRKELANRKRKVLRIWRNEPGFATYLCVRCGLRGWEADRAKRPASSGAVTTASAYADQHANRQAGKALYLWRRSQPAEGSPVEIYLRDVRRYSGPIPSTVAYLPATKPGHYPGMISAFGCTSEPEPGVVKVARQTMRGVHITFLKPDGTGKAGTGRDKIMVGPSNGWPIVLAAPNDLLGLVVVEGIETGFSIHEATGLGVWAAGAAGRMPELADKVPNWIDYIAIAAEADEAGRRGAIHLAQRLHERGLRCEIRFLGNERAAAA